MGLFDFFKKPKVNEPFTETAFSCRRDDLTIRGTEFRPEGADLPVAIVSHGFMATQDTVFQYAKELARMGYCTYTFDFCGGCAGGKGKSDGATTDMSGLLEAIAGLQLVGTESKITFMDPENGDKPVALVGQNPRKIKEEILPLENKNVVNTVDFEKEAEKEKIEE